MASDPAFMQYVVDQVRGAGNVSFRKMFGEYAVYLDEKVVALVCDNQLFVKPTPGGRALLGAVTDGAPYPGAKAHFLVSEQLEDRELMSRLLTVTASELPVPKPRKPKRPAR
jgi:TfoX/Sxy family transcriptional regulator of competence genes